MFCKTIKSICLLLGVGKSCSQAKTQEASYKNCTFQFQKVCSSIPLFSLKASFDRLYFSRFGGISRPSSTCLPPLQISKFFSVLPQPAASFSFDARRKKKKRKRKSSEREGKGFFLGGGILRSLTLPGKGEDFVAKYCFSSC